MEYLKGRNPKGGGRVGWNAGKGRNAGKAGKAWNGNNCHFIISYTLRGDSKMSKETFIYWEDWNGAEANKKWILEEVERLVTEFRDSGDDTFQIAYSMTGDTLIFVKGYARERIEIFVCTIREMGVCTHNSYKKED